MDLIIISLIVTIVSAIISNTHHIIQIANFIHESIKKNIALARGPLRDKIGLFKTYF